MFALLVSFHIPLCCAIKMWLTPSYNKYESYFLRFLLFYSSERSYVNMLAIGNNSSLILDHTVSTNT